jgi:N-acetylglucosaminyldiphosphoundecaprenol N-acetyl-beta-D-mannosaminyltransferase
MNEKMEKKRKYTKILDINVDVTDLRLAINEILRWIDDQKFEKRKAYVCFAPVSTIVQAKDNPAYKRVLDGADMVAPDGMPVVWVMRIWGEKDTGRVCGPDLMESMCYDPRLSHIKHFFFGTTDTTLFLLEKRLRAFNRNIKIVGKMAPPFHSDATLEPQCVIDHINQTKPDILWVALGSPKQNFWMELNRSRLDVPVIIGVGAAFDFLAGVKPRAPKWMQNSGLEWLFRLGCEPRRLWHRYVVLNSRFLYEIMLWSILQNRRKGKR